MHPIRTRLRRTLTAVALAAAPAVADVYTVVNTDDAGTGSLRWAIAQANAHAGADAVAFNLPGSGVRVIALQTPLPSLAASTSVLGATQPGYAGTPIVRVDGQDLPGNFWGFDTGGAGVAIRGLQIVRFNGPGIRVWHDNVSIRNNFIGTDGTVALPNTGGGIVCLGGSGLTIGGLVGGDGNVISGNGGTGVDLWADCGGSVVWGNRIGTDAAGVVAIPNQGNGLAIASSDNVVGGAGASERNVISGNVWEGILLWESATGNTIQGNRIGTDLAGAAALGNGASGIAVRGDGNTLGGTLAGAGNVLSGNGVAGAYLYPEAASNTLLGNRIGTDAAGAAAIANAQGGVTIYGTGNTVGGAAAGAANVVSGNAYSGIVLGDGAAGNQVLGNRIGTNLAGTAALGNAGFGLFLGGDGDTVGGTAAGAGNLISGNGAAGVAFAETASGCVVLGNRIGTDLAGGADLGNAGGGVGLAGSDNQLGGATAAAGNLISGNAYDGVAVNGAGTGLEIANNRIGTNAAGTAALGNDGYGIRAVAGTGVEVSGNLISGNGRSFSLEFDATDYLIRGNVIGLDATMTAKVPNQSSGIDVFSPGHQIGGTAPGEGNVIAGNVYYGIALSGPAATGVVVAGNWIGTTPALAANLGNNYTGVLISEASGNTIGGTAAGAGNVVAHNGYLGVFVWSGAGNAILGNSIHDNGLLGIDLDPQGPLPNDAGDLDAGANRGQNFPVVTSALASGGDLAIEGFLEAAPATEYRIELFSSPAFDPTGVGEGASYLGAQVITTDGGGHATFAVSLPAAGGDAFVTATATSPAGDTSEFSPAIAVGAPQAGQLQIWRDPLLAYEGTPGLAVTIVRSHGVAGAVAVDVATVDVTAQAPEDYGALATTLTFAPGETMKQVFVPVVDDQIDEADEKWRLQLANPQGGAALGAQDDVLGWIFDSSPAWPLYAVADVQILEGDSGQKNLVFTITLSATDHDVPVAWWTSDGSATAGEDYVESEGEVLFHPGESAKTFSVPVVGDGVDEFDEVFYVHLYGLANAIVWDGLGEGRIVDDDGGAPTAHLFSDSFESGAPNAWSTIQGWP